MPLPQGVLKHVFPAGKQMPQLRGLKLVGGVSLQRIYDWVAADDQGAGLMSCVDGFVMDRIAQCCPGLTFCRFAGVLMPQRSTVEELRSLPPSLQELHVSGAAFGDHAAVAVAHLTNLNTLVWGRSPLTPAGLQRLTALQGLTQLTMPTCPGTEDPETRIGLMVSLRASNVSWHGDLKC